MQIIELGESMIRRNAKSEIFCVYTLTPDTSFHDASVQGIMKERLMIYAILETDSEIKHHNRTFGKLMEGYK